MEIPMNTSEAIKKLRQDDLLELSDLIDQFGMETSFERTTGDLDDELRSLTQGPLKTLTSDDREAITGYREVERSNLVKAREQKRQASMKKLSDFLPGGHCQFHGIARSAYNYLERRFAKTQDLQEVMGDAMMAVEEHLTKEELTLMEKAKKALDVSLFIQLMAKGLMRPEPVA
jgi:hypothetical protein